MRTYSPSSCRFSSDLSAVASLTWADASFLIKISAAISLWRVVFSARRARVNGLGARELVLEVRAVAEQLLPLDEKTVTAEKTSVSTLCRWRMAGASACRARPRKPGPRTSGPPNGGRASGQLRPAMTPPSTFQIAPVTQSACFDSRKMMTAATSSEVPVRPRGEAVELVERSADLFPGDELLVDRGARLLPPRIRALPQTGTAAHSWCPPTAPTAPGRLTPACAVSFHAAVLSTRGRGWRRRVRRSTRL